MSKACLGFDGYDYEDNTHAEKVDLNEWTNTNEKIDLEKLYEELEKLRGKSITTNILGGIEAVYCMSGFNAYIDTCYDNKDILFLNSDEGIGCDIHIEDIKNIYKNEFMVITIYIELKNSQILMIWSEDNNYADHEDIIECNQD